MLDLDGVATPDPAFIIRMSRHINGRYDKACYAVIFYQLAYLYISIRVSNGGQRKTNRFCSNEN